MFVVKMVGKNEWKLFIISQPDTNVLTFVSYYNLSFMIMHIDAAEILCWENILPSSGSSKKHDL